MSGLESEVIFFKSVSDFAVKVSIFGGFLSIAGVIDFVFTLNIAFDSYLLKVTINSWKPVSLMYILEL